MKSYEATARTVEEAISQGLLENGLSIGDVTVEILEEGSKGLFGLFGSRDAKVRLTLIEDEGTSETLDLFKNSLSGKSAPAARREEKKPQDKPARTAKQPKQAEPKADSKPVASNEEKQPRPRREKAPRAPRQNQEREEKVEAAVPYVREVRVLRDVENPAPDSPEGQVLDFLKELTKLMGLEITVTVALDEEGHVFAKMDGDPQGILIGRRGETLDALQYLTSLKVNKGRDNYVRVTLDSEGYRQKREEALVRLANRMANRARKTGRRVTMEPMNPYERRIFHSALQSTPGIATHSEGEDLNRHIVITPVKDEN